MQEIKEVWLIACVGKLGGKLKYENGKIVETVVYLHQCIKLWVLIIWGFWLVLPCSWTQLSMKLKHHSQCIYQCLLNGCRLLVQQTSEMQYQIYYLLFKIDIYFMIISLFVHLLMIIYHYPEDLSTHGITSTNDQPEH